jgi:hypothetical protein
MYITPTRLADFKERYKKQYGREIDDEKAYEMASNLVGLYRAVYLPADQKTKDESESDS